MDESDSVKQLTVLLDDLKLATSVKTTDENMRRLYSLIHEAMQLVQSENHSKEDVQEIQKKAGSIMADIIIS